MNQKRIQVPPGMLKAACLVAHDNLASHEHNRRIVLEAALRWLSGNPIVPTDRQMSECGACDGMYFADAGEIVVRFQRDFIFAPYEPEVPEAIRDLLWEGDPGGSYNDEHNQQILEAYRRGKQAK